MIEKFGESTIFLERYFKLIHEHSSLKRFKHSEGHHIFPKFVFGENKDVRYVSFRVHFILHELLWKHFRKIGQKRLANKAAFPLVWMRAKNKSPRNLSGIRISSRSFEAAKMANSLAMSGENNPMFGKPRSPDTVRKISESKKGLPMPEEQRLAMVGRRVSDEARLNMSKAKRPVASPEECAARSERMKLVWAKRKAL